MTKFSTGIALGLLVAAAGASLAADKKKPNRLRDLVNEQEQRIVALANLVQELTDKQNQQSQELAGRFNNLSEQLRICQAQLLEVYEPELETALDSGEVRFFGIGPQDRSSSTKQLRVRLSVLAFHDGRAHLIPRTKDGQGWISSDNLRTIVPMDR